MLLLMRLHLQKTQWLLQKLLLMRLLLLPTLLHLLLTPLQLHLQKK